MGWGAGRKLGPVLENTRRVLAVEILSAVQGIDYRAPLEPAPGTQAVAALVRNHVPPLEEDRPLSDEIESIAQLIGDGSIQSAAG